MDNIINKDLYKKAKKKADETYERHSAYKSMYIQKVYKELGGKYAGSRNAGSKLTRWNSEQWIQVIPFLKDGKKIACGEDNKKNKVCRPFKRIDSKTPITISELLKIHSKKDLLALAIKKNKNMDRRIYWKNLKIV